MFISTKYRTDKEEVMDDFTIEGHVLITTLGQISNINQQLGGNKLTLQGVKRLLVQKQIHEEITIVDVGCGNGDMLRTLAEYGMKNNLKLKLIGIDANQFTINHAMDLSIKYPNISYRSEDIFDKKFSELKYDIVLCTLTLHHFKEEEILNIMNTFYTNAKLGVVINDLHRSSLAYRLFQLVCMVFRLNDMSREDGLTSILRGFKRADLMRFSNELKFKNFTIHWRWAFRYEWIISKI
ncbi:methyltransferase domain-containing protein [Flavobacterium muglaense]|uniref:Methyltransferase domain-containing protein n=1 Tax=Flavobacterium muglaense TaxID=2764716 RepID=A0A923SG17_9FLAO|nr:methyltransferase domain-containing protein [Flavobacterium muglaense]MBC5838737.1 methyltransferase domain-containing protein [Flavobacterium muglaense]MBC5845231.1 methyltransferase domain-containing protein [Flavobacterium muglaense]